MAIKITNAPRPNTSHYSTSTKTNRRNSHKLNPSERMDFLMNNPLSGTENNTIWRNISGATVATYFKPYISD
jgi:hypothetical protein